MVEDQKNNHNEEEFQEDGESEEDVYTEGGREELEESDEINELEEGFMEGYEEGEHQAKCAGCSKVLVGEEFIEEEIEGHHYRFCTEECANAFELHKKIKRSR